jgi:hypothetical protein
MNAWVKKTWFIHMIEYYLAIKKNGVLAFAQTWINCRM